MTKKIPKIISKYPKPDQKLLPKVYLTWDTARQGTIYLDCKTGKHISNPDCSYGITWRTSKNSEILTNSGSNPVKFAYCKYHPTIDAVEFAVVEMSTRRTGGARQWEYAAEGERYFVDKNKQVYDANGKEKKSKTGAFDAYKYHNAYGFKNFLRIISRLSTPNSFMREFKKMINIAVIENGRGLSFEYPWEIQAWYMHNDVKKKSGKTQTLLDTLTALPHKNISNICRENPPKDMGRYTSYNNPVYFEKLNDTWSVLRYCYRQKNNDSIESYRVYISEDGKCQMTKLNNSNEWIPAQSMRGWYGCSENFVNFEDMSQSKRLSYIMPILKDINSSYMLQKLISIVKYPEIEQIYKMGCKTIAFNLLSEGTPNANMKEYFGDVDDKAKTLFNKIKLNKHQLQEYDKRISSGHSYAQRGLATLRKYWGDDLSSIDNETFDSLFAATMEVCRRVWRGYESMVPPHIDHRKFIRNLARLNNKHDDAIRLLFDTISIYRSVSALSRPEINWYFDDRSDIVRLHDALIEIQRVEDEERRAMYNMQEAERRKKEDERRKKLDEQRKHYEYEDADFIIRLPKDVREILDEGSKQRICIGGYTSSHSNGNTNLFFLRRKSNADTPFYAIEMNNNKQIVQIHGFGNKWLGNDPDAIPTVIRWLRKNGIACDDKILTCTATGYGRNNNYVAMPVVD